MAPSFSNAAINTAIERKQPIWRYITDMERLIIKTVCILARQNYMASWDQVAGGLDWENIAREVGPGVTRQYCREQAEQMWPHTYLAGGKLQPDRAEVRKNKLKLPRLQAMRGVFHKSLTKVEKSSSQIAHGVRKRKRQMRGEKREASLLASYAKIMSPPKADFPNELHDDDDDNHEATAAEIEALIEEQERNEEEERALDADLRARENELRALEGAKSPLPSPLHGNGCWVQSGDGMTLLRIVKVDEHVGVRCMVNDGGSDVAVGVVVL